MNGFQPIVSTLKEAKDSGFVRLIPSTDLDSLITASVLLKTLLDQGVDVALNFDTMSIVEQQDEYTILIGLPPVLRKNLVSLPIEEASSLSATVTYSVENTFGADIWVKTLSIVAGLYRWLDQGREGFRGLEKGFVEELVKNGYLIREAGFKLPGWRRVNLVKSIYRSFFPFIPGFSGNLEGVQNFLTSFFRNQDYDKLTAAIIFEKRDAQLINSFLRSVDQSIKVGNEDLRRKLLYRLVGYTYSVIVGSIEVDLMEIINALSLTLSLEKSNMIYAATLGLDRNYVTELIVVYEKKIDETIPEIASLVETYLKENKFPLKTRGEVKRPEVVVDALKSLDLNPPKPVSIEVDGLTYTTVSECLRVGKDPVSAYTLCDENQLCRVDEKGDLLKV